MPFERLLYLDTLEDRVLASFMKERAYARPFCLG
jgi:hypothetical protein